MLSDFLRHYSRRFLPHLQGNLREGGGARCVLVPPSPRAADGSGRRFTCTSWRPPVSGRVAATRSTSVPSPGPEGRRSRGMTGRPSGDDGVPCGGRWGSTRAVRPPATREIDRLTFQIKSYCAQPLPIVINIDHDVIAFKKKHPRCGVCLAFFLSIIVVLYTFFKKEKKM